MSKKRTEKDSLPFSNGREIRVSGSDDDVILIDSSPDDLLPDISVTQKKKSSKLPASSGFVAKRDTSKSASSFATGAGRQEHAGKHTLSASHKSDHVLPRSSGIAKPAIKTSLTPRGEKRKPPKASSSSSSSTAFHLATNSDLGKKMRKLSDSHRSPTDTQSPHSAKSLDCLDLFTSPPLLGSGERHKQSHSAPKSVSASGKEKSGGGNGKKRDLSQSLVRARIGERKHSRELDSRAIAPGKTTPFPEKKQSSSATSAKGKSVLPNPRVLPSPKERHVSPSVPTKHSGQRREELAAGTVRTPVSSAPTTRHPIYLHNPPPVSSAPTTRHPMYLHNPPPVSSAPTTRHPMYLHNPPPVSSAPTTRHPMYLNNPPPVSSAPTTRHPMYLHNPPSHVTKSAPSPHATKTAQSPHAAPSPHLTKTAPKPKSTPPPLKLPPPAAASKPHPPKLKKSRPPSPPKHTPKIVTLKHLQSVDSETNTDSERSSMFDFNDSDLFEILDSVESDSICSAYNPSDSESPTAFSDSKAGPSDSNQPETSGLMKSYTCKSPSNSRVKDFRKSFVKRTAKKPQVARKSTTLNGARCYKHPVRGRGLVELRRYCTLRLTRLSSFTVRKARKDAARYMQVKSAGEVSKPQQSQNKRKREHKLRDPSTSMSKRPKISSPASKSLPDTSQSISHLPTGEHSQEKGSLLKKVTLKSKQRVAVSSKKDPPSTSMKLTPAEPKPKPTAEKPDKQLNQPEEKGTPLPRKPDTPALAHSDREGSCRPLPLLLKGTKKIYIPTADGSRSVTCIISPPRLGGGTFNLAQSAVTGSLVSTSGNNPTPEEPTPPVTPVNKCLSLKRRHNSSLSEQPQDHGSNPSTSPPTEQSQEENVAFRSSQPTETPASNEKGQRKLEPLSVQSVPEQIDPTSSKETSTTESKAAMVGLNDDKDMEVVTQTPQTKPTTCDVAESIAHMERTTSVSLPEEEGPTDTPSIPAEGPSSSRELRSPSAKLSERDEAYGQCLLETIAKLAPGSETTADTSRASRQEEVAKKSPEEEPLEELTVQLPLSQLTRTPAAVTTRPIGMFRDVSVQAQLGMTVDKDVLDNYLIVKLHEAMFDMKEQLQIMEAQVASIAKQKESLERTLQAKTQYIRDMTTTGFKPTLVEKGTMTDPAPELVNSPTSTRALLEPQVKRKSRKTKVQESGVQAEPKMWVASTQTEGFVRSVPSRLQGQNKPVCLYQHPESELQLYIEQDSSAAACSSDAEGVSEESILDGRQGQEWLCSPPVEGECSRSVGISQMVRFMRAIRTSSQSQHCVRCSKQATNTSPGICFCTNAGSDTRKGADGSIAKECIPEALHESISKLTELYLKLKALPKEPVQERHMASLLGSVHHLLGHLPMQIKPPPVTSPVRQTTPEHSSQRTSTPPPEGTPTPSTPPSAANPLTSPATPGAASWAMGARIQGLLETLQGMDEKGRDVLPKYFRAELTQLQKKTRDTLTFLTVGLRHETFTHDRSGCITTSDLQPHPWRNQELKVNPFFHRLCLDIGVRGIMQEVKRLMGQNRKGWRLGKQSSDEDSDVESFCSPPPPPDRDTETTSRSKVHKRKRSKRFRKAATSKSKRIRQLSGRKQDSRNFTIREPPAPTSEPGVPSVRNESFSPSTDTAIAMIASALPPATSAVSPPSTRTSPSNLSPYNQLIAKGASFQVKLGDFQSSVNSAHQLQSSSPENTPAPAEPTHSSSSSKLVDEVSTQLTVGECMRQDPHGFTQLAPSTSASKPSSTSPSVTSPTVPVAQGPTSPVATSRAETGCASGETATLHTLPRMALLGALDTLSCILPKVQMTAMEKEALFRMVVHAQKLAKSPHSIDRSMAQLLINRVTQHLHMKVPAMWLSTSANVVVQPMAPIIPGVYPTRSYFSQIVALPNPSLPTPVSAQSISTSTESTTAVKSTESTTAAKSTASTAPVEVSSTTQLSSSLPSSVANVSSPSTVVSSTRVGTLNTTSDVVSGSKSGPVYGTAPFSRPIQSAPLAKPAIAVGSGLPTTVVTTKATVVTASVQLASTTLQTTTDQQGPVAPKATTAGATLSTATSTTPACSSVRMSATVAAPVSLTANSASVPITASTTLQTTTDQQGPVAPKATTAGATLSTATSTTPACSSVRMSATVAAPVSLAANSASVPITAASTIKPPMALTPPTSHLLTTAGVNFSDQQPVSLPSTLTSGTSSQRCTTSSDHRPAVTAPSVSSSKHQAVGFAHMVSSNTSEEPQVTPTSAPPSSYEKTPLTITATLNPETSTSTPQLPVAPNPQLSEPPTQTPTTTVPAVDLHSQASDKVSQGNPAPNVTLPSAPAETQKSNDPPPEVAATGNQQEGNSSASTSKDTNKDKEGQPSALKSPNQLQQTGAPMKAPLSSLESAKDCRELSASTITTSSGTTMSSVVATTLSTTPTVRPSMPTAPVLATSITVPPATKLSTLLPIPGAVPRTGAPVEVGKNKFVGVLNLRGLPGSAPSTTASVLKLPISSMRTGGTSSTAFRPLAIAPSSSVSASSPTISASTIAPTNTVSGPTTTSAAHKLEGSSANVPSTSVNSRKPTAAFVSPTLTVKGSGSIFKVVTASADTRTVTSSADTTKRVTATTIKDASSTGPSANGPSKVIATSQNAKPSNGTAVSPCPALTVKGSGSTFKIVTASSDPCTVTSSADTTKRVTATTIKDASSTGPSANGPSKVIATSQNAHVTASITAPKVPVAVSSRCTITTSVSSVATTVNAALSTTTSTVPAVSMSLSGITTAASTVSDTLSTLTAAGSTITSTVPAASYAPALTPTAPLNTTATSSTPTLPVLPIATSNCTPSLNTLTTHPSASISVSTALLSTTHSSNFITAPVSNFVTAPVIGTTHVNSIQPQAGVTRTHPVAFPSISVPNAPLHQPSVNTVCSSLSMSRNTPRLSHPPSIVHMPPVSSLCTQPPPLHLSPITLPIVKLQASKVYSGLLIKWTFAQEDLSWQSYVERYDLYAFVSNRTAEIPDVSLWGKVGEIKPLALPMAVTLTNFAIGQRYAFAVRVRYVGGVTSRYSNPCTIDL